ncbi:MAG: alpha/beta hydrolase [Proteobacteria bacterium]|nr:alpha/beta hydrolase [Pseudomonadota bacterium]
MASCHQSNPKPEQAKPEQAKPGAWPPSARHQIAIWPQAVPDMAGITQPAESIEVSRVPDRFGGLPVTGIKNVSVPTMTVFPAKGQNTGAAVVVFPGGGFEELAIDLEGTEVCDWITAKGVTCIVSKYRVPKSDDQYDSDCNCHITPKVRRALQDAQRTIRLVRARASEFGIDPHKIGVIGFSAGGYLVVETSNVLTPAYKPVDAADQISSRPDFAIAIYPGQIWRGNGWNVDPSLHVTRQTPPTFVLQAWDDKVDGIRQSLIYAHALEDAGVPAEVHLFAKGGHAFGLRPTGHPVDQWPGLVEGWLREIGILPRHS